VVGSYLVQGAWFPSHFAAGRNRSYPNYWVVTGDPWYLGYKTPIDRQHAFYDIKKYLSLPPVMKAPMAEIPFQLYIAVEDAIIGAVLMQVVDGKVHIITYLSRCLIDAETRYSFIEKVCLSLFYACSKL
jgi:hypothetical protein